MTPTRRVVLGTLVAFAGGLAGCGADEEDPDPGLHAVGVLVLYRSGDGWYDYPDEAGVRVTVENTDVDRHRGTLVVTLQTEESETVGVGRREVNLPGGTSRTFEIPIAVGAVNAESFDADARVES
ncbi:MAG: hypothetical protein ABEH64_07655 [Salinirussus sp.]